MFGGKKVDLLSVRNFMREEKGGSSSGRGRKDKGKGKVGSSRTTAGDSDVVMGMPAQIPPRRGHAARVPSGAFEGGAVSKRARDNTPASSGGSTRGRGKGLFCYGAKESLGYDTHWDAFNSAYSLESMQRTTNERDLEYLQKYNNDALLEFHAGDLARAFHSAMTLRQHANEQQEKVSQERANAERYRKQLSKASIDFKSLEGRLGTLQQKYDDEVHTGRSFLDSENGRAAKRDWIRQYKTSESFNRAVLSRASGIYRDTIQDCRRSLHQTGRVAVDDLMALDPTLPMNFDAAGNFLAGDDGEEETDDDDEEVGDNDDGGDGAE